MSFAALIALALVFATGVRAEEGEKKDPMVSPWTGTFENKDGKCYFKTGANEFATAPSEKATEDAKTKLGAFTEQLVGKGHFKVTGEIKETNGNKWIAVDTITRGGRGEHGERH